MTVVSRCGTSRTTDSNELFLKHYFVPWRPSDLFCNNWCTNAICCRTNVLPFVKRAGQVSIKRTSYSSLPVLDVPCSNVGHLSLSLKELLWTVLFVFCPYGFQGKHGLLTNMGVLFRAARMRFNNWFCVRKVGSGGILRVAILVQVTMLRGQSVTVQFTTPFDLYRLAVVGMMMVLENAKRNTMMCGWVSGRCGCPVTRKAAFNVDVEMFETEELLCNVNGFFVKDGFTIQLFGTPILCKRKLNRIYALDGRLQCQFLC